MSTDPFSASIVPFEVPEQVRAFAEKGVSQAREGYAKFKDAAETHNSTVEAVFGSINKGASAYSAKVMEFVKANTTTSLDFAQQLFSVCAANGGKAWDHSAMVRALEIMANFEVAQAPGSAAKAA